MREARELGVQGEDRAAAFLQEKGFTIVTRRFKAKHGEIDLVALDGETLVFVEVKLSRSPKRAPEEAVSDRKRQRLSLAATEYLARFADRERPVRYDVVAVGPNDIRHQPEAFWPDWRGEDDGMM